MKVYIIEIDNGEDWEDNHRHLDSVFSTKELAENHLIKKGFKRSINYSTWTKDVKNVDIALTLRAQLLN